MKKKIIATILITGLTLGGVTLASANKGMRWNGNQNQQNVNCPMIGQNGMAQLDPAIQEKIDTFWDENMGIKREMAVKSASLKALMRGDNPDPETAAKITGELFDLRAELKDRAEAAGVEQYLRKGPGKSNRNFKGGNNGGRFGGQFGSQQGNQPMMGQNTY